MTINILKTESFLPLGPAIKKPIAEKPFTPEQVRPGVFKGVDGKLYTDFKANETPAVFHPPKQQVPNALNIQITRTTSVTSLIGFDVADDGSLTSIGCFKKGSLHEVTSVPGPLPTLPVVPNSFKVGDRVVYNEEYRMMMGNAGRVIERIRGDELYFQYPFNWDYSDRMVLA